MRSFFITQLFLLHRTPISSVISLILAFNVLEIAIAQVPSLSMTPTTVLLTMIFTDPEFLCSCHHVYNNISNVISSRQTFLKSPVGLMAFPLSSLLLSRSKHSEQNRRISICVSECGIFSTFMDYHQCVSVYSL